MGKLKHKTDVIRIGYYHGTIKCLKIIVKNLKLKPGDGNLDIVTMALTIHSKRITLLPGDCYQYLFSHEKFEAIG